MSDGRGSVIAAVAGWTNDAAEKGEWGEVRGLRGNETYSRKRPLRTSPGESSGVSLNRRQALAQRSRAARKSSFPAGNATPTAGATSESSISGSMVASSAYLNGRSGPGSGLAGNGSCDAGRDARCRRCVTEFLVGAMPVGFGVIDSFCDVVGKKAELGVKEIWQVKIARGGMTMDKVPDSRDRSTRFFSTPRGFWRDSLSRRIGAFPDLLMGEEQGGGAHG